MSPPSSLVAPVDYAGVRKGLVATTDLLAGTLIQGDHPGFVLPSHPALSVIHANPMAFLASLPQQHLLEIISIPPSPNFPSNLIMARVAQLFPVRLGDKRGVFLHLPRIGRVEHSCVPNSIICHSEENGQMRIDLRIISHIPKGSPILVNYFELQPSFPFSERQKILQSTFGSSCSCCNCGLSSIETRKLEARIKEFGEALHSFNGLREDVVAARGQSYLQKLTDLAVVALEIPSLRSALIDISRAATTVSFMAHSLASGFQWGSICTELCKVYGVRKAELPDPRSFPGLSESSSSALVPLPQQLRDFVASLTTPPSSFLPLPSSVAAISSSTVKASLPSQAAAKESLSSPELPSSEKVVEGEANSNASMDLSASKEDLVDSKMAGDQFRDEGGLNKKAE